ncbi:MAG: AAA family ATPase [Paludibacteraceae bacterium]|nr:AAA family ATPase [Paludibacteraceae bacterium]
MLTDFIIGRVRAELPFEPNAEKEGLLQALGAFIVSRDARKAFVLRGYAGTGKTSVMSALVRALEGLKQPCVLLAPTGRAAKVLSRYSHAPAYTIHKYIYRQNQLGREAFSLSDNIHRNTLFIVDEASMLSGNRDNPTFGSGCLLDDLVSYVYKGSGCSLLLVGDDAQLPPVGSSNSPALEAEWMASSYQLSVFSFQLKEVARQALDSGVLSEATRLRGELGELGCLGNLGSLEIKPNGKDIIQLKGEEVIETLEASWREVGAEETLIIARSNRMTNLYNQGVRARVLWKEDELSNGDRVMVVKNNYFWAQEYDDLEFIANGDMFEVQRLYNHHELYGFHFATASLKSVDYEWEIEALVWLETLTADNPEATYRMQKELFAKIAEDYPEIRNKKELVKKIYDSPYYNALQIRFAYCVTCHKSQGGQWKHVYIDKGLTSEGVNELTVEEKRDYLRWIYTAVTRATEKIYVLR